MSSYHDAFPHRLAFKSLKHFQSSNLHQIKHLNLVPETTSQLNSLYSTNASIILLYINHKFYVNIAPVDHHDGMIAISVQLQSQLKYQLQSQIQSQSQSFFNHYISPSFAIHPISIQSIWLSEFSKAINKEITPVTSFFQLFYNYVYLSVLLKFTVSIIRLSNLSSFDFASSGYHSPHEIGQSTTFSSYSTIVHVPPVELDQSNYPSYSAVHEAEVE